MTATATLALRDTPHPQLAYKDLASRFETSDVSLQDVRAAVVDIRAGKFPDLTQYGTAGSFFKNPVLSKKQYELLQEQYL